MVARASNQARYSQPRRDSATPHPHFSVRGVLLHVSRLRELPQAKSAPTRIPIEATGAILPGTPG